MTRSPAIPPGPPGPSGKPAGKPAGPDDSGDRVDAKDAPPPAAATGTPRHAPVLLAEVLEALAPAPGRLVVDATLGLGGHSEALLGCGARVLALDRDPESIALARTRLAAFEERGLFRARHADYRSLLELLAAEAEGPVDGVLADLGVSSFQLLSAARGFSFSADAPLDMRMDRTSGDPTAADLVNTLPEEELARLFFAYGEEREARRVVRAISRRRGERPFATTADLAEVVASSKRRPRPGERERIHPATLVFQALRIAVNDELTGIDRFVEDAIGALRRGGRLAVIAFHSLEDRQVKQTLRRLEKGCVCPPAIVLCACGKVPQVRLLWSRPRTAGAAELALNPRSRSAKLRAAEKVTDAIDPRLERAA